MSLTEEEPARVRVPAVKGELLRRGEVALKPPPPAPPVAATATATAAIPPPEDDGDDDDDGADAAADAIVPPPPLPPPMLLLYLAVAAVVAFWRSLSLADLTIAVLRALTKPREGGRREGVARKEEI